MREEEGVSGKDKNLTETLEFYFPMVVRLNISYDLFQGCRLHLANTEPIP